MADPAGGSSEGVLRLNFDRRLTLQFRGSVVTSDAGLLAYRELDDAVGLSDLAGEKLADARTGKNGRHALVGMLRRAVFGRLAGYEDVNDAEQLRHDPAMRWIVGGKAASGCAASASQMGCFETRWLTAEKCPITMRRPGKRSVSRKRRALTRCLIERAVFGKTWPAAVRLTVRPCQERETVAGWVSTGRNLPDVGQNLSAGNDDKFQRHHRRL